MTEPTPPTNDAAPVAETGALSVTVRAAMEHLETRGLLTADDKARAAEILHRRTFEAQTAIKALTAIGAWLSAAAFLGFITALLRPEHGSAVMVGLGYCTGAIMLRRVVRHEFFVQAALALLLAGYGAVMFGVADSYRYELSLERFRVLSAAAVALAAMLYILYDYPLQRFLVPLVASCIVLGGIDDISYLERSRFNLLHALAFVEMLGMLCVFTVWSPRPTLRPLGFALAIGFGAALVSMSIRVPFVWHPPSEFVFWPSQVSLAIGLLWLTHWASQQSPPGHEQTATERRLLLASYVGILILALLSNPGIMAALLLLILGHAAAERALVAAGFALLLISITILFANLQIRLTAMAGVLTATGLLLLCGWFVLWRLAPAPAQEAAQ
ncbi:MAG TPA: DUF4401 domain-containing protein [Planctomycetota bacterium]|jgi:hypothetical protein